MKRHLSTFIGGAIVGSLSFGIWPEMWKTYGIMGGFLTATVVIGIMWYMNHWLGMVENPSGKIWVDQGFAVSAAGIVWGVVRFDAVLAQALPTFICCAIGGILAAAAAVVVKRVLPRYNGEADKKQS